MFKQISKKIITDKYPCKKCGQKAMYPNIVKTFVKGYKCEHCGTVNYPVKDILEQKSGE